MSAASTEWSIVAPVGTRPVTALGGHHDAETFTDLEVATVSADTLRASIRITGCLVADSASLLTAVLRTHVGAGRRYLRVDLATAQITDTRVVDALVAAHRTISDLGGMLVFENAGPRVIDAIRNDTLFVRPAD